MVCLTSRQQVPPRFLLSNGACGVRPLCTLSLTLMVYMYVPVLAFLHLDATFRPYGGTAVFRWWYFGPHETIERYTPAKTCVVLRMGLARLCCLVALLCCSYCRASSQATGPPDRLSRCGGMVVWPSTEGICGLCLFQTTNCIAQVKRLKKR